MSEKLPRREFAVTRDFDAPLEQVWRAWIDPEWLKQWWGPQGYTCPLACIDFRQGGISLLCMRSLQESGGQDLFNTWIYRKIVPLERIEYILNFTDKNGDKIDPATLGMPAGVPPDVYNVNLFEDLGDGRTKVTILEFGYTSDQAVDLYKAGLEQCLNKLAAIFAKT